MELELGEQDSQLIYKGEIDLENLPLVFVGYGIDAAEEYNYDEYADVDVEGKVVVLIRREPQQTTKTAYLMAKTSLFTPICRRKLEVLWQPKPRRC